MFLPPPAPRPNIRPLTLVNTGSLSLRKGTPYLLEAFRLVREKIPGARLLLTRIVQDDVKPVLCPLSGPANRMVAAAGARATGRTFAAARTFSFCPRLKTVFARTVTEALACGLPVITTPNTGASDLIQPGVNGEVVPIRDPQAIAEAIFKWAEKTLSPDWQPRVLVDAKSLSFEHFERTFIGQLRQMGWV